MTENIGTHLEKIRKRMTFFSAGIELVQRNFVEVKSQTFVHADAPEILSRAYFLLNDAYRSKRMPNDSLTNEHKRAGLTAATIMAVRPFIPIDDENIQSEEAYLANSTLCMLLGAAWLGHENPFARLPQDYQLRHHTIFLNIRLSCLEHFLNVVNSNGRYRDILSVDISLADSASLDDIVTKFFMLDRLRPI
ncbi:MAG: hypothetical protein AAGI12_15600 [Pseudomonadota bacterium]